MQRRRTAPPLGTSAAALRIALGPYLGDEIRPALGCFRDHTAHALGYDETAPHEHLHDGAQNRARGWDDRRGHDRRTDSEQRTAGPSTQRIFEESHSDLRSGMT